jgi:hypothetical protein
MLTDAKKKEKVRRERARLQVLLPCEFADGARCGLTGKATGAREPGGYPKGVHGWLLERRNASWAGWNIGDLDRRIIEGAQDD